jgi:hypothetical protein
MPINASDDALLGRPIVVIGAPRTGTSILGALLGRHRDLVYCEEPRLVWRYGNDRRSDALRPEDARPAVRAYIRAWFAAYVRERGGGRLVEKTPANSLRMAFVDRVLPGARFVHVLRNPIDAVLSIQHFWSGYAGGVGHLELRRRLMRRLREIDPRQLPHYALEFSRRLLPRRFAGVQVWGPRFPGVEGMLRELDLLEVCAMQWRLCVEAACRYGRTLPAERYLECRLEAFDHAALDRILAFCELDNYPELRRAVDTHFHSELAARRRAVASAEEQERVKALVEPTAAWLGYEL